MKLHEVIELFESPLRIMHRNKVNLSMVNYLSMYNEYCSMMDEGLKKDYIVSSLCGKYNIGRTKSFELVKYFEAEIF